MSCIVQPLAAEYRDALSSLTDEVHQLQSKRTLTNDPKIEEALKNLDRDIAKLTDLISHWWREHSVSVLTPATSYSNNRSISIQTTNIESITNDPHSLISPNNDLERPSSKTQNSAYQNPLRPLPLAGLEVPYLTEDGIFVLLPQSMKQCRDLPFLHSQAERLGAVEMGVFKFVLPDDFNFDDQHIQGYAKEASTFKAQKQKGYFKVFRKPSKDPIKAKYSPIEYLPAEDLANDLEAILDDPQKLKLVLYGTDLPARDEADRRELGLPSQSPIWPLDGNQLDQTLYEVPGLHWPCGYMSNDHGGFFTIHKEDCKTVSLNVCYAGCKVWIAVDPADAHKIEEQVTDWDCAQKIRHAARYYQRAELKAMGVKYFTFCQRPREVVFTYANTYHQGGATASSIAEAVNCCPPGWSIADYEGCNRSKCPGDLIPNKYMEFRSPGTTQLDATGGEFTGHEEGLRRPTVRSRSARDARPLDSAAQATRSTGSGSRPESSGEMNNNRKRSGPSMQNGVNPKSRRTEPHAQKANPKVQQLVAAIQGIDAIEQFRALVQGRRDSGRTYRISTDDRRELVEQYIHEIIACQSRSKFNKWLTREVQLLLAQDISTSRNGALRADSKTIKKIMENTGWSRSNLNYHLDKGNKWKRLVRTHDGLLCFIADCSNSSPNNFLTLSDADLETFHQLLDNNDIRLICSVGNAFRQSLDPTMEDVEFRWETRDPNSVPKGDLFSLQPFPSPVENVYNPDAYPNWPRPTGWPEYWTWPVDPTSIPHTEKQCDLCTKASCQCFRDCAMFKPRIKNYGKKGRGLQAVAGIAGSLAVPKGGCIGYLTGELTPLGTFNDGWAIELVREDLNEEPSVCQVHCANAGNYLRLLNHSCKSSAKFFFKKVSGKYRVSVVAVRDIHDGEEITVDYGRNYMAGEQCLCGEHKSV